MPADDCLEGGCCAHTVLNSECLWNRLYKLLPSFQMYLEATALDFVCWQIHTSYTFCIHVKGIVALAQEHCFLALLYNCFPNSLQNMQHWNIFSTVYAPPLICSEFTLFGSYQLNAGMSLTSPSSDWCFCFDWMLPAAQMKCSTFQRQHWQYFPN